MRENAVDRKLDTVDDEPATMPSDEWLLTHAVPALEAYERNASSGVKADDAFHRVRKMLMSRTA